MTPPTENDKKSRKRSGRRRNGEGSDLLTEESYNEVTALWTDEKIAEAYLEAEKRLTRQTPPVTVKAELTTLGDVTLKLIPEVFFPSYMLFDSSESAPSNTANSTNTTAVAEELEVDEEVEVEGNEIELELEENEENDGDEEEEQYEAEQDEDEHEEDEHEEDEGVEEEEADESRWIRSRRLKFDYFAHLMADEEDLTESDKLDY